MPKTSITNDSTVWQSIETAPRDGTIIFVQIERWDLQYSPDSYGPVGHPYIDIALAKWHEDEYAGNRWVGHSGTRWEHYEITDKILSWHPVPIFDSHCKSKQVIIE